MADRKKKHRILKRAGIAHASGHIYAKDYPAFQRLVDKAKADVDELTKEKDDESISNNT